METKTCTKCGQVKPATVEFWHKKKNGAFGLAGRCKPCRVEDAVLWAQQNRERVARRMREWRQENITLLRAKARAHREKNHARILAEKRLHYRANKDRYHALNKKWKDDNPEWRLAKQPLYTAQYRAAKRRSAPPWLTSLHHRQIAVYYRVAARKTAQTGIPHHVDHIVPLRGRNVCGLHVPWNLRITTAAKNLAKGNSFDRWSYAA